MIDDSIVRGTTMRPYREDATEMPERQKYM